MQGPAIAGEEPQGATLGLVPILVSIIIERLHGWESLNAMNDEGSVGLVANIWTLCISQVSCSPYLF